MTSNYYIYFKRHKNVLFTANFITRYKSYMVTLFHIRNYQIIMLVMRL